MTAKTKKQWKAWGVFDARDKLVAVRLSRTKAEEAAGWGDYEGICSIGFGAFTLAPPKRKARKPWPPPRSRRQRDEPPDDCRVQP